MQVGNIQKSLVRLPGDSAAPQRGQLWSLDQPQCPAVGRMGRSPAAAFGR